MAVAQTFAAVHEGRRLSWSVPRLWELAGDLPVLELPLAEFSSYLDRDPWFDHEARPTTRAVAAHCKQIIDADLKRPIILDENGLVMDGVHRLAKAWLTGAKTIRAVRFAKTPEPDAVDEV